MQGLFQDLWQAARSLARRPGFTLAVTGIIGLGIGAVVTLFSLVDSFLLQPLPYPGGDRLVWIQCRHGDAVLGVSHADYLDWKSATASFQDLALFNAKDHSVLLVNGGAESLQATRTTASLFPLLGLRPVRGRAFTAQEDREGSGNVMLLSYELWARLFARDRGTVGRTLMLDGAPYTVIGIMPPGFSFPVHTDVWVPSSAWADQWPDRNIRVDSAIGRLRRGISLAGARTDLARVAARLEEKYPETNAGVTSSVTTLRSVWTAESRSGLLLLLAACCCVLLIACSNVANLVLVRTQVQQRERAISLALGASPWQPVRKSLIENLLLGLAGGAVGVLLASWGLWLIAARLPADLPTWIRLGLEGRALGVALAAAILSSLLFGLGAHLRAFRAQSRHLAGLLRRDAAPGGAAPRDRWSSRSLVAAQIAVVIVLLTAAGALLESFLRIKQVEPGFDPNGVLSVQIHLPIFRFQSFQQVLVTYRQLLDRIGSQPGVDAVAATTVLPLAREDKLTQWELTREGQTLDEQRKNPRAHGHIVTAEFFRVLRILFLSGRTFEARDTRTATAGAVVSHRFAQRFWPDGQALGKRFRLGGAGSKAPFVTVVGVVADIHCSSLTGVPALDVYLPLERMPAWPIYLVVRSRESLPALVPALRQNVRAVSADLGLREIAPLQQRLEESLWQPRMWAALFGIFSGLALLLACAGVYGVVAYQAQQRAREVGIRVALGADRPGILWAMLRGEVKTLLTGTLLGLGGALAASRLLSSLLFEASHHYPAALALSAVCVGGVAFLASVLPILRVLRIDPMSVLKIE